MRNDAENDLNCSMDLNISPIAVPFLVPGAIHVRVPGLDYPKGLPTFAEVAGEIDGNVLALGTISFIAQVLDHLGAPTDLW